MAFIKANFDKTTQEKPDPIELLVTLPNAEKVTGGKSERFSVD